MIRFKSRKVWLIVYFQHYCLGKKISFYKWVGKCFSSKILHAHLPKCVKVQFYCCGHWYMSQSWYCNTVQHNHLWSCIRWELVCMGHTLLRHIHLQGLWTLAPSIRQDLRIVNQVHDEWDKIMTGNLVFRMSDLLLELQESHHVFGQQKVRNHILGAIRQWPFNMGGVVFFFASSTYIFESRIYFTYSCMKIFFVFLQ